MTLKVLVYIMFVMFHLVFTPYIMYLIIQGIIIMSWGLSHSTNFECSFGVHNSLGELFLPQSMFTFYVMLVYRSFCIIVNQSSP